MTPTLRHDPYAEKLPLPFTVGLTFGMVKKIKREWFVVNQSKMRINFAERVKNVHNVDVKRDFGDWAGKVEGRLMGK